MLNSELHKQYLERFLHGQVPCYLQTMDTNRAVLMFFCLSGLEVLGEIENIPQERKEQMINWLYGLYVQSPEVGGFQGSPTFNAQNSQNDEYKWGHIATTYSSLLILLILGDNMDRINKQDIIQSLKVLQLESGSFKGAIEGVEDDMRFVFCAAAISFILQDWSGVDVDKMVKFIINSVSYDGGVGQGPDLESHCGSTFCAVAALALSGNLDKLSKRQLHNLRRWLLFRLDCGFNGRPNKPVDTCYSFWAGGALKILNAYHFIESDLNPEFILMAQDKYGGFSKWVNSTSDPMHTYFGLAGLSLMNYSGLTKLFPALNCTERLIK